VQKIFECVLYFLYCVPRLLDRRKVCTRPISDCTAMPFGWTPTWAPSWDMCDVLDLLQSPWALPVNGRPKGRHQLLYKHLLADVAQCLVYRPLVFGPTDFRTYQSCFRCLTRQMATICANHGRKRVPL
jgi:hypothetical protein